MKTSGEEGELSFLSTSFECFVLKDSSQLLMNWSPGSMAFDDSLRANIVFLIFLPPLSSAAAYASAAFLYSLCTFVSLISVLPLL